jgi:hypothetical protein
MLRDIRLGDDIDDFCVRCKRVMNHAVVSVINAAPAKVRCRTCHSDHDYRHEQAPPPKVDARKAALFSEVLKKVSPGDTPVVDLAAVPEVEPEVEAEVEAELEPEVELEGVEVAIAEEPPPVEEPPQPKVKAKATPRKAAAKATATGKGKGKPRK